MAFWFQQNFVLAAGKTMNVDYWFNSGAFNGANMATAIPHYAANAGLLATGQGLRYDFTSRRYFYNVIMSNTGSTTANFQLAGGGFV